MASGPSAEFWSLSGATRVLLNRCHHCVLVSIPQQIHSSVFLASVQRRDCSETLSLRLGGRRNISAHCQRVGVSGHTQAASNNPRESHNRRFWDWKLAPSRGCAWELEANVLLWPLWWGGHTWRHVIAIIWNTSWKHQESKRPAAKWYFGA